MADLSTYDPAINAAAAEWGHDPDMLRALILQESGGNPKAVSKAGARGLTGLMPKTASGLGVTDPNDTTQQIFGAAKYLAEGRDKEGSPEGALLYYHGGPNWRKAYGNESAGYVPGVAGHYTALKDAAGKADGAAVPSDADFLKQTAAAAPAKAEAAAVPSDDEFLKQTGAAPGKPVAAEPEIPRDPELTNQPQGIPGLPAGVTEAAGRVGAAAGQAYRDTPPIFTPQMEALMDQGPLGRWLWNPLARAGGVVAGSVNAAGAAGAQAITEGATAAGQPALGRDINMLAQVAPMAGVEMPGVPMTRSGLVARDMQGPVAPRFIGERTGEVTPSDTVAAPLPPAFRDNPIAPGNRLAMSIPPQEMPLPAMAGRPGGEPVPQSVGAAASRDTSSAPLPELSPAQKATALQKMVNQTAEDRLTPQGRDDATYFPGVVRPEAMRDFTPAAEGKVSSAMEHKTLYNTDSNYHDMHDAQVKKNNTVMVDGLHDMFGDVNTREAAMEHARSLMPGSVQLFEAEKPVNVQPIADTINKILAGPAGKIDGVANTLKKILPKLQDAAGNPETLPSQIKGVFDDINNKLFDKSPTIEGNEARQASSQLKAVKAAVSDVIGSGLPGTKWADYLTNLSDALGHVDKLDYMQQFLAGSKKLTNLAGDLQLNKVQKMLEDIQKHSTDQTGGARHMTLEEINLIEAARNELAAKDLLDRRAAVRGSPTAQITNSAGILGSGPLGAGIKGSAELALHAGLAAKTFGAGNAALAGYRFIVKPAVEAAKAQKAANTLAATKNRLLNTEPRLGRD